MSEVIKKVSKASSRKSIDSNSSRKTASAPNLPITSSEKMLKPQISAPSYFFSLHENPAPPFQRPGKPIKPHIVTGTIMKEEDVVNMIMAMESDPQHGLKKFIGNFLVEKKVIVNYSLSEKTFLTSLVCEVVDYAAQRDFKAFKLACLITCYLTTHIYFKWSYWIGPFTVWEYFKEIMIRHTIQDSPDGEEVFSPEECYDILTHFHNMYITNLPLVHIATFGCYRIKLTWPFKSK